MKKPNILILMPDQQRGDCLSCAGHPVIQTPNMDEIAAEGMRFSRAYTTCPVCMPARSSFISGLYNHNHGQWSNRGHLGPNTRTFLHSLKEIGYHNCLIGKSHLHPHRKGHHLNEGKPFMRSLGWDDILETTGPGATQQVDSIVTDHWREIGCLETYRADYRRRGKEGPVPNVGAMNFATWPSPMPKGEHLDDFIGRTAVDYLARYDFQNPFLVFVGFAGPHLPWDPPVEWAAKYDPAKIDTMKPIAEPGPWVPQRAAEHQRILQNRSLQITKELNAKIRALYYAKISHIDSWFGRILDILREREILNNTIIIFWSDHGEMLCDKGRLAKSVFYEESVRIPLIIRPVRKVHPSHICERLVSLVDVFPTILDMVECRDDWRGFGKSLMELLEDPEAPHHDAVFSEVSTKAYSTSGVPVSATMIRDEQYKMIVDRTGTPLELYDLGKDPDEMTNLVGKKDLEKTISHLKHRMLQWYLGTQKIQDKSEIPQV